MTAKERAQVREDVEEEGFHYTFADYSDYEEIEDEEFHRLRTQYLDASKALMDYIGIIY